MADLPPLKFYLLTSRLTCRLMFYFVIKMCHGSLERKYSESPASPFSSFGPGRVAQSIGHLTRKLEVLGSIPGLVTYFRFSFR